MIVASVICRLPGAFGPRRGVYAVIGEADLRDYNEDKLPKITNRLRHAPPVQNNVSYYNGTFETKEAALQAVKSSFPTARIKILHRPDL